MPAPFIYWLKANADKEGSQPFLDTGSRTAISSLPPREGEASGDASGLQKRFRQNSVPADSPLLECIFFVFLAFTDLDGLITFRLD